MKHCIKIIAAGLTLAVGAPAIAALTDARQDLGASAQVLQAMEADANISGPLARARAVLLVPTLADAPNASATGVLVMRSGGAWINPVFYDLSGFGAGTQARAASGSAAYLLMSDHAVEMFKRSNTFSLTAQSGFSIDGWSARNTSAPAADVIAWSSASDLLPQATAGISAVTADRAENQDYYNRHATPDLIMNREVRDPHVDELPSVFKE
ncbi:MAG TPA: YSC84-related protein [Lacunisphaera sp.]|jgi:lipid-binding SYLF domain-containing protein|nr:YSC84-related protein [Lacunisphaera sp.]